MSKQQCFGYVGLNKTLKMCFTFFNFIRARIRFKILFLTYIVFLLDTIGVEFLVHVVEHNPFPQFAQW